MSPGAAQNMGQCAAEGPGLPAGSFSQDTEHVLNIMGITALAASKGSGIAITRD